VKLAYNREGKSRIKKKRRDNSGPKKKGGEEGGEEVGVFSWKVKINWGTKGEGEKELT